VGEALEIGTGSGAMAARLLAAFPALRLVATDYDPDLVHIAQQTLAAFGERARAVRADASDLPFEDGRFDAVLSFAMLHHVGDWEKAVAEAVRVLRPGGRLLGYDLLNVIPLRLMHRGFRLRHRGEESDTRMMRPGELEKVLASLPLTDVRTRRGLAGLHVRFSGTKAACCITAPEHGSSSTVRM